MSISFLERRFGGHLNIGPITFYGYNSMRWAINIKTRWGYVCFQPPVWMNSRFWPWKFYISPNATPQASTFAMGPGVDQVEKVMSGIRRYLFGHNYVAGDDFVEWNRQIRDYLEHLHSLNLAMGDNSGGSVEDT